MAKNIVTTNSDRYYSTYRDNTVEELNKEIDLLTEISSRHILHEIHCKNDNKRADMESQKTRANLLERLSAIFQVLVDKHYTGRFPLDEQQQENDQ